MFKKLLIIVGLFLAVRICSADSGAYSFGVSLVGGVDTGSNQTIAGNKTFTAVVTSSGGFRSPYISLGMAGDPNGEVEIGASSSTGTTPYIDFHYGVGSPQDFNTRIINMSSGTLSFQGAGSSAYACLQTLPGSTAFTTSVDTNNYSTPALFIRANDSSGIYCYPSNASGLQNPIIQQGDASIVAIERNLSETGVIDICPWSATVSGIRITTAAVTVPNLSATGYYRKNAIINGDMDVWQRGVSTSTLGLISNPLGTEVYLADRWQFQLVSSSSWTMGQSTDTPTAAQSGSEINYSLKFTVAKSTPVETNSGVSLRYPIEGYDFRRFVNQNAILSFWVKSSSVGLYDVGVYSTGYDNVSMTTRYPYTITTINTWQFVTIPILFNCNTGTWNYTTGVGLNLHWGMSQAGNNRLSTVQGATFELTHVQLELGTVATAFEPRPIGQEIMLCQRYYRTGNIKISGKAFDGDSSGGGYGYCLTSEMAYPSMRTTPTFAMPVWTQRVYHGNGTGITVYPYQGSSTSDAKLYLNAYPDWCSTVFWNSHSDAATYGLDCNSSADVGTVDTITLDAEF